MSKLTGLVSDTAKLSLRAEFAHPLDPLSAQEIAIAVQAAKEHIAAAEKDKEYSVWFKSIQQLDPPKKTLAPLLDEWHAARARGQTITLPPRAAEVLAGVRRPTGAQWYEFIVNLDDRKVQSRPVPAGLQVPPDFGEMIAAEQALFENEEFLAVVKKLGIPANARVVADGWIYGADSKEPSERYTPFMVYLSFIEDGNSCQYSAPLPIVPVLKSDTFELVRIDYAPIMGTGNKTLLDLDGPFPWDKYIRREYDYDVLKADGMVYRDDIKPYRVIQPEGASFRMEGRVLRWQKWSIHVGFNYREGVVLSDIRYDGRKVFYRLSVSEMTVPYGDPRSPYHRKQAFDLGDLGAGVSANELQLGCDCLGDILYLDWDFIDYQGEPMNPQSVVCIHEEDNGIGWKHTNFRTMKPSVTRSRILVIQMIITVANYEYIFAFKFDQAAGVHLETRATGILSTAAILPGETSPYGNVVAPGVLGTNHQHLFSMRIDPSIDGHANTVVQEDSVPMPFDKHNPPANNPWGVGYTVERTPITKSGFADAAPEKNRCFKIQNSSVLNPISGKPVAYKLVPVPSQLLLAHPDSIAHARAEFAQHHLYVTQHRDHEYYAGGKYTNMSNGNAQGMRSFIGRGDNVENDDIVVWHTFGLTHNPRIEDFPVMPCETIKVSLVPADFHVQNPAIDVPPSTQAFNRSHLVGANGQEAASCCPPGSRL